MFVFMVMLKIIRKTSAGTNRSTKNLACYVFLKQIKTRNNFELMIYLRCDAKLSVTLIFALVNLQLLKHIRSPTILPGVFSSGCVFS